MRIFFRAVPFLLFTLFSCTGNVNKKSENQDFEDAGMTGSGIEAQEIIYAFDLPTDVSQLFERSGTNFNPELLTDLQDLPRYDKEEPVALVMGALGIDLSYCKVFGQTAYTASYYEALEQLSDRLDIPQSIFISASQDLERYFDDPDSLSFVLNHIYTEVNNHFKSNDRDALAAISLFGGWIEAMQIAARIYDEENHFEMGTRILHQKFALNQMITLLSNYQESLEVRGYVLLLHKLRKEFDGVQILYEKEGFRIDTSTKKLQISGSDISYEEDTLDRICSIIVQIHTRIFE